MRSTPLLAMLALTSACVISVETESVVLADPGQPYERVVVDVDAGKVNLLESTDGTIRASSELEWSATRPEVRLVVEGSTLRLEVTCTGVQFVCGADSTIELPANVPVRIDVGSGDVRVEGAFTDVAIDHGAGKVEVFDATGDVTVDTGTGDIELQGLTGANVDARTATGGIFVEHLGGFDRIDVGTGVGDVTVEVPEGSYNIDISTGVGPADIERGIVDDPNAGSVIKANSGVGTTTVRAR